MLFHIVVACLSTAECSGFSVEFLVGLSVFSVLKYPGFLPSVLPTSFCCLLSMTWFFFLNCL